MTAAAWQTAGIVAALIFGVIGAYFAARSNARDQSRQRQSAVDKAVTDAKAPLIADNARLSSEKALLIVENQRLLDRVTQLEDRLYGERRPKP